VGWVKRNVAKDKDVRGIVVVCAMDEKLKYAALIVSGITLSEYEIDFGLKPAHLED
jgi:hypothetical protein